MKELLYVHLVSMLIMLGVSCVIMKQDREIDGYITLMNLLKYMAITFTPAVNTFASVLFVWVIASDFFEDGWNQFLIKLRTTKLFEKEVK